MAEMLIKGVMLDMARVTERHDYYFALPQRLAAWGYDTVFAHFNDDAACALRFDRRPELADRHAFTKPEMARWISTCEDAGLMVVPEIESFGHTAYIFGKKKYAHLADITRKAGHFSGINPLHPDTRAIMRDLVEETAELFDSPYLHAGLDEVRFGQSPEVKRALKKKELWEIFADYVDFMHGLVTRAGKKMMMWGDHLLSEPRIAQRISKDIIVCNWHYKAEVHAGKYEPLLKQGFQVIACPATNRAGDMVAPNANNLANLQRSAWLAHELGCIGLINTVWCPQRMLCGVEQAVVALGGAWFADPKADPRATMTRFVRGHFGLSKPAPVASAMLSLIQDMPRYDVLASMMNCDANTVEPAASWLETQRAQRLVELAERHRAALIRHRASVKQNRTDYDNYVLACEVLSWAGRVCLARAIAGSTVSPASLRAEGKTLHKRCQAAWNKGRYADDPTRDNDQWRDALIPNLKRAVERLGR